jgi:hypothetical protein
VNDVVLDDIETAVDDEYTREGAARATAAAAAAAG